MPLQTCAVPNSNARPSTHPCTGYRLQTSRDQSIRCSTGTSQRETCLQRTSERQEHNWYCCEASSRSKCSFPLSLILSKMSANRAKLPNERTTDKTLEHPGTNRRCLGHTAPSQSRSGARGAHGRSLGRATALPGLVQLGPTTFYFSRSR
mgnify:CR=1 FL=1